MGKTGLPTRTRTSIGRLGGGCSILLSYGEEESTDILLSFLAKAKGLCAQLLSN